MKILALFVLATICFILFAFLPSTKKKTIEIPNNGNPVSLKFNIKNKYGFYLPPEPPSLKSRSITVDGYLKEKKIFSILLPGFNLNVQPEIGCDVKWSNANDFFSIKTTNHLLIFDSDGNLVNEYSIDGEFYSSMNWNSENQLILVVKKLVNEDVFSYTSKSYKIKIIKIIPLENKVDTVLSVETQPVYFTFCGIGFNNQEISPKGNNFVYSTGEKILIFNINSKTYSGTFEYNGDLDGIWWLNEQNFVAANVMSGNNIFYYYSIPKKHKKDISYLFEKWNTNQFYNVSWYNSHFQNMKLDTGQ